MVEVGRVPVDSESNSVARSDSVGGTGRTGHRSVVAAHVVRGNIRHLLFRKQYESQCRNLEKRRKRPYGAKILVVVRLTSPDIMSKYHLSEHESSALPIDVPDVVPIRGGSTTAN